jgi:diguanylate cyclase (GGDEF)-like protein
VQTDPVTASRLLHMANSSSYVGRRPVAAVPEAVRRVGLKAVSQLAMGFSLVDQYREGTCKGFDYLQFWSHSLLMAVAMQELGQLTRIASPDELFACALMARIGHLALATLYPEEYARVLQEPGENMLALEQQLLHVDHNEFTAAILADCGIPHSLAEPVRFHETPDASGFTEGSRPYRLAHLFHHARRLADLSAVARDQRNLHASELMLLGGKIGLDADDLGELIDKICTRWNGWSTLLNVPTEALPPFSSMVSQSSPSIAREHAPLSPRVLLVASNPARRSGLQATLNAALGVPVHAATDGQHGLAQSLSVMPQVVVVDTLDGPINALAFCRALRETEWGKSMYLLMLTASATDSEIGEALAIGVNDCLSMPVDAVNLKIRMGTAMQYVKLLHDWEQDRAQLKQFSAELAISNRKLERYALTDLLTGLQNRRAGMETLSVAWGASQRSGEPLAVMMIDIDQFKSINDRHGHATGDRVLIEVATALRAAARKEDSICRIGGEEFLVLCRNTDVKASLQAAERLRDKVEQLRVSIGDNELKTTVRIGIACRQPDMKDPDMFVQAADKALYAAKEEGRNRIKLFHGSARR